MTFQAVGYLWAASAAALVVVVLHLLARRRPRPQAFPTARFVPERAVRAPAFNRRPSDLPLLALRVVALLSFGLALARPALPTPHDPVVRLTVGADVPSLSAAFAAALRASAVVEADSVDLTIAMPLTRDRWDAATAAWRGAWPGAVRAVATPAPARPPARVEWPDAPGGDALDAVVLGDLVAVGHWGRTTLPPGHPVVLFHDGTPAAVEVADGRGCVRHVGIGIPNGDARLQPAFRRIARRLRTAPCGGLLADDTPLDSARIAFIEGAGGPAPLASLPSVPASRRPSALLFVLGALALAGEQVLRRRAA